MQRFAKKSFCLLAIKFVIVITAFSQCPASVTTTVTESRCKENGRIVVNATPAAPYTYEIVAGPSLVDPTTSNTFTSLPPGNYTIEVSLGGCAVQRNVTVPGNYVEPGLISLATVNKIACPSGTACATANQPTGGRLPWQYSIISGPVLKPLQSSPTFCGLTAGLYSIQAIDSCGVVRTTQFTVGVDTGDFFAYAYGYDISRANCTDIAINLYSGFTATTSHTLMKVWYVAPNGDSIKANNFTTVPLNRDTLVGYAHTYGSYQIIAWDTCGRKRVSNFTYNNPSVTLNFTNTRTCAGYSMQMTNNWKWGLAVGFTVKKCDGTILYSVNQTPPGTSWYGPPFDLEYDSCYILEHYNECGDTVRRINYINSPRPVMKVTATTAVSCVEIGTASITLTPSAATLPIQYTIISGPQNVGTTYTQSPAISTYRLMNMALGIYTFAAVDACGQRDTVNINANKALARTVTATKSLNCSGGADLHLKITSNYPTGGSSYYDIIRLIVISPAIVSPINVVQVIGTTTLLAQYDADFVNINADSIRVRYWIENGCAIDTTIRLTRYVPPSLSNLLGFVCDASNIGTLNYSLTGGKAPYKFRIKPDTSPTWGAWQDSAIFTGMTAGVYDIEVQDGCPNGQIRSVTFYEWTKSDMNLSSPCATIGSPFTLKPDPYVNNVSYQWYKDGVYLGTSPLYTIPSFSVTDNGRYTLKQTFRGGGCVDSVRKWVVECSVLPLTFGDLTGTLNNNIASIKWNTFRDAPGTNFYIQRSADASSFIDIANVACGGNPNGSDYSFTDKLSTVTAFYRIKYVSLNDKVGYSNTIRLSKKDVVENPVTVSPVPFNTWLSIRATSTKDDKCLIKLFDASGKTIYTKIEHVNTGNNVLWLDDDRISRLNKGIYYVEILTSEFTKKLKIMKQ